MRVLVTGGSGRIGQATIAELIDHGHEVLSIDRRRPRNGSAPVRTVETDLTDVGQIVNSLRGCDAVIHLGAIPAPYSHPDDVVFVNNTGATFAVLQAASLLEVRRAVIASSVSAYGNAFAPTPFDFWYAPVGEDHPLLVQDPYGLSKEVDERTAATFHRRTGMSIAAMRFHWVAMPEELARFAPGGLEDPSANPRLLWGYVDVRDAAAACRHGIEQEAFGCEAFNITAADTLCSEPTEALIRSHLPGVELRSTIAGTDTAFSLEKAKRLLGWQPVHSWRQSA